MKTATPGDVPYTKMILKTYRHAPAHLFVDGLEYFFTGSVYLRKPLLKAARAKEIFLENLLRFCEKYGWILREWVVLDNHYHFLTKIHRSKEITKVINSLHKTSAFHIQKELIIRVKPFWYQYWDRCIRNEYEYFRTANYILYNPIKHGIVKDLEDYAFSSYKFHFGEDCQKLLDDFTACEPTTVTAIDGVDEF
jgi:putative transposase